MNRAVQGLQLFEDDPDYDAFERVLAEAVGRFPAARLCAYCLMPNHFHLVLWPREDGLLSRFMQWLAMTHTQRWHAHRQSAGRGHLYQGRFRSFPIQEDGHFLSVCRYVERNPLRSGLVSRSEAWRWSSLSARRDAERRAMLTRGWPTGTQEAPGPPGEPGTSAARRWIDRVNRPETPAELDALRRCVVRGGPYGDAAWSARTASRLGLESTTRPRGRPRIREQEYGS